MEEKNRMDINKLKETIRSEIERGQYSLMNDELFGYVFGREESRDITAEFLSAALEKDFGHPITGISFVPPMELPVHGDLDQVSRFMARCELGDEEHIFAELQLVNYMESRELPLACCATMYSAQPEYDLHPCTTVSILSYSLLKKTIIFTTSKPATCWITAWGCISSRFRSSSGKTESRSAA